jgi:hypothetical protein
VKRLQDYFSVEAAAAEIPLKYKTLLQRIARGKVKHEKLGRVILVPTCEVSRLKEEKKQKQGRAA